MIAKTKDIKIVLFEGLYVGEIGHKMVIQINLAPKYLSLELCWSLNGPSKSVT